MDPLRTPRKAGASARRRPVPPSLHSPVLTFLLLTLATFLVMTLFMWFLRPLFPYSDRFEVLVEVSTMLAVMTPLLYFLFVRPMARGIQEKTQAEAALQNLCEDLESRVKLRTAELEAANVALHKEIEDRIRAAKRFQIQARLLNAVQQAVFATDADGVVIYWNRFAEDTFGWSQSEVRGRPLADLALFPPKTLTMDMFDSLTARSWDGEASAARRDGGKFPAFLTFSPIWMPDCSIGGFAYTLSDITDRKEAEEALRNSEEKYSTVVENSPTGIFILQGDRIVFANRRFFEMVALAPEDLWTLVPAKLVHSEDWARIREVWQGRFAGGKVQTDYEFRVRIPDGKLRWFNGRSAPIRVGGQKVLLVNIQDVTERREAEQALRESQRMLHQLSTNLITAQEGERRRVAQDLHDSLGQSLSAIKFMVESLLDSCPADVVPGVVVKFRSVVPLIQSAMEEVRRISMALRPSTLDDLGLLMTLSWFTREFQNTYPGIEIEKHIEVEEAQVPESLKTNIFRILQEAMNNAAKHSRAGRIRVSLRRSEDWLELRIEDEGVGFDLSQVRKPDVQGGLGLSSMRERAELFGGQCTIVSTPGAGTAVTTRWTLESDRQAKSA